MDELYAKLKEFGRVRANEVMRKHTTFQIGGAVQFLVEVTETEKLVGLLDYLTDEGVPYFILGGGSNLLWTDENFEGVVIKVKTSKFQVKDNIIEAEAGVQLPLVVNLATQNGLAGVEWAVGIPGTIGGATRGNAGAMGQDMSKSVFKAQVWRVGEVVELNNQECGFVYRGSSFKQSGGVVLRVWLKLTPADKKQILIQTQKYSAQRQGKFPAFPSAGSFFKNIKLKDWPGDIQKLPSIYVERQMIPAGWVIEQAGLLGLKVGGATVAKEHGNFIINAGAARQEDVLTLVEKVKEEVYNKFKVELQSEVEILK
ncbi:MAG: UDP-N-acetylmuramate dehydrogenase [Patescibacteria group bacterium]